MYYTYAVAVAACEGPLHNVLHSSSYIVSIFLSKKKKNNKWWLCQQLTLSGLEAVKIVKTLTGPLNTLFVQLCFVMGVISYIAI